MARRTLNRHALRAEAEAAEALGLNAQTKPRASARPRSEPALRTKPAAGPRMRVVWAVCDVGGRTVKTFDYTAKAAAEAYHGRVESQRKRHPFRAFPETAARVRIPREIRKSLVS